MDDMKIFSGNANRPLAEKICQHLGVPLGEAVVGKFSDGELMVEFRENVRGKDVFVVQPFSVPCNEYLVRYFEEVSPTLATAGDPGRPGGPGPGYVRQRSDPFRVVPLFGGGPSSRAGIAAGFPGLDGRSPGP